MLMMVEEMLPEIGRFVEMDAAHWDSDEGCLQAMGLHLFYRKFDDVLEIECDGIIIETQRYTATLL